MDFLVTKIREIHKFQPTEAILSHHKTGPASPVVHKQQADDKGTTTLRSDVSNGIDPSNFWTIIQTCTKQVSQHLQHHVTNFYPLRSLGNRKDTEISAQPAQPARECVKINAFSEDRRCSFCCSYQKRTGHVEGEREWVVGLRERTCRYGD